MRKRKPTVAPVQKRVDPNPSTVRGAFIGGMFCLGMSATEIASRLGDGTHPSTVRTTVRRAQLPQPGMYRVAVPVHFSANERDKLERIAAGKEISLNTLLYRIALKSLLEDNLYDAIIDGSFDQ